MSQIYFIWNNILHAENLAPTGIRSLDLPARSESLYGLRYPEPYIHTQTHTHTHTHTHIYIYIYIIVKATCVIELTANVYL